MPARSPPRSGARPASRARTRSRRTGPPCSPARSPHPRRCPHSATAPRGRACTAAPGRTGRAPCAGRRRLCSIDGQNGVLIYGGYDVRDLAEHSSYEEVCFLILRGHLPTARELSAFNRELAGARGLSEETARVVDMLAGHAEPMEM